MADTLKIARRFLNLKTFRLLFVFGLLSEAVYVAYFLRLYYLLERYQVPFLDIGKITRHEASAAWQFVGAFTALFAVYYGAYRLCLSRQAVTQPNASDGPALLVHQNMSDKASDRRLVIDRASVMLVVGFAFLFSFTLLFIYPVGAADVFDYMFHGRILVHYGQNPFQSLIADYPDDPLYPYPAWKYAPSVYGPIWVYLSAIPSLLAGDDLLLNILYYKGMAAILFLLSTWFIYRSLWHLAPGYALPGTLLFAWNPLTLYETAGNGHNDIAMVFFATMGIYLFATRRQSLSIVGIVASGLMKFVGGLLAPLFLSAYVKEITGWGNRASFIARIAIVSAVLAVALYAPFWIGLDTLGLERRKGMFTDSIPTIAMLILTRYVGDVEAQATVARISVFLFAIVLGWTIIRVETDPARLLKTSFNILYIYLLFFCLWFQPWYVIWILALAAVVPKLDTGNKAMLFSYTAVWSYFVFTFVWTWNFDRFDALAIQGYAVAAVYTLPILLTIWRPVGNSVASRLRLRISTE